MHNTRLLLVLVLLILTACQPTIVQPTAEPTPTIAVIQTSPGLGWMSDSMAACAQEVPGLALVVEEIPPAHQNLSNADVVLRWDAPLEQNYPTFVLAEERLEIILHPSNPVTTLTKEQIADLFSGNLRTWDQINPELSPDEITVWIYSENNEAWILFNKTIWVDLNPYYGATLVPHPQVMREEVAGDPAAIGLLPARWLDGSVKPVTIQDLPAGMLQPIVAITRVQPAGPLHDWLGCLQAEINP